MISDLNIVAFGEVMFRFSSDKHECIEQVNRFNCSFAGLLYSRIRDLYLNINENRLIEIKKNYLLYKYFLTEKTHFLSFPIIIENEQYVMYQIVKNE